MKTGNLLKLLILMSVIFTSCNSKEEWQKKLEKDLRSEMGDPYSFEFISHKLVDSIKVAEIIEHHDTFGNSERFKNGISYLKNKLKQNKKNGGNSVDYYKEKIEKEKKNLEKTLKKRKEYLECIEQKNLDKDKYVVFVYEYNYRSKNTIGVMAKKTLYVALNHNEKRLRIAKSNWKRPYIYIPVESCRPATFFVSR